MYFFVYRETPELKALLFSSEMLLNSPTVICELKRREQIFRFFAQDRGRDRNERKGRHVGMKGREH